MESKDTKVQLDANSKWSHQQAHTIRPQWTTRRWTHRCSRTYSESEPICHWVDDYENHFGIVAGICILW